MGFTSKTDPVEKGAQKEFVERIYISNLPILLRCCERFCRTRGLSITAEEFVQEVCLQITREIELFEGLPDEEVKSLIVWIIRFTGMNFLRIQNSKRHDGRCVPLYDIDPEEFVRLVDYDPYHERGVEFQDLLETALGALDPIESAILMNYLARVPIKEIALEFGLEISAVRKRIVKALDRLRFHIQKHYPEVP